MIMNLKRHLTHPIFQIVQSVSNQMGIKSYVVGGWVRDIILNRESKDIDIVCLGSGIELANEVAKQIGGDCNVSVFKNLLEQEKKAIIGVVENLLLKMGLWKMIKTEEILPLMQWLFP